MNNVKVFILLATYNGERFLRNQLDSIIQQTHANWQLIISDDTSDDNTLAIIDEYITLYHDKIRLLVPMGENLGSVSNFNRLFNEAKSIGASYTMFCDQDDYWFPSKIALTLNRMFEEEAAKGAKFPLLIHTNFTYADAELKPIQGKTKFQARRLRHLGLQNLIIQNPVYGCTSMFNKALANKIHHIPSYAENHDFWVALVASAFGAIVYIPESTMFYRQHGGNISTQHDYDGTAKRIKRVLIEKKNVQDVKRKKIMIGKFFDIYSNELSPEQQSLILGFLAFLNNKRFSLAIANFKKGVRMQTAGQTLLFYLTALLRH